MQLYDVVRSRFQQYEADAQRLLGLLNPRKSKWVLGGYAWMVCIFFSCEHISCVLGVSSLLAALPPLFTRTSDMATRLEVVREVRGHLNALKGEMVDQFARGEGNGLAKPILAGAELGSHVQILSFFNIVSSRGRHRNLSNAVGRPGGLSLYCKEMLFLFRIGVWAFIKPFNLQMGVLTTCNLAAHTIIS